MAYESYMSQAERAVWESPAGKGIRLADWLMVVGDKRDPWANPPVNGLEDGPWYFSLLFSSYMFDGPVKPYVSLLSHQSFRRDDPEGKAKMEAHARWFLTDRFDSYGLRVNYATEDFRLVWVGDILWVEDLRSYNRMVKKGLQNA